MITSNIIIVPKITGSATELTISGILHEGTALSHQNWVKAKGTGVRFHIQHDGSGIDLQYLAKDSRLGPRRPASIQRSMRTAVWNSLSPFPGRVRERPP